MLLIRLVDGRLMVGRKAKKIAHYYFFVPTDVSERLRSFRNRFCIKNEQLARPEIEIQ